MVVGFLEEASRFDTPAADDIERTCLCVGRKRSKAFDAHLSPALTNISVG